jgi:hypothetical protein
MKLQKVFAAGFVGVLVVTGLCLLGVAVFFYSIGAIP